MRGVRLAIAQHKAEKTFKKYEGFSPRNENLLQQGVYPRPSWTGDELHRMLGIYRKTKVPCSCYMCGNPRKYWGKATIQEVKQCLDVVDQFNELDL